MKHKTLLHYCIILLLSIAIVTMIHVAFFNFSNPLGKQTLLQVAQAQTDPNEPQPSDGIPTPTEIIVNPNPGVAPSTGACAIPLIIPPLDIQPADDWKDDKPLCIDPDPFNPNDPNDNNDRPEISNCDQFNTGTYYANYWWCHPRKVHSRDSSCVRNRMGNGEDEDDAIHHCNQNEVVRACRGWGSAHYLTAFRSRVDYLTGKQTSNSPQIAGLLRSFINSFGPVEGRRATWNYLMAEVRSGWTTFGMKSYSDDIELAANHIFQKSWAQVLNEEKAKGCGNAWEIACKNVNQSAINAEEIRCKAGYNCSSNGLEVPPDSVPSYTCKNPSGSAYQPPGALSFETPIAPSYFATECKVRLAIPPKDFALEINPDPGAKMTKENYFKRFDTETKTYSTDDLPRPEGRTRDDNGNSIVDPTYCYINNHPINIDNAKCGTSWYYSWAQCSPGGSWRPTVPHGPLPAGTSHGGATACEGTVRAWDSPFLVNFRNLVDYNYGSYGAHRERLGKQWGRSLWNFIMSEVRTGNTTFGQMYSWESDMDYMSQKVFGKSWNDTFNEELRRDCPMDTWEFLCREEEQMEDALYPVVCKNNESCSSHHDEDRSEANPATFTCSGYDGDMPNPGPRGYLESASCAGIQGWACDVSKKGQPSNVYIFDGPATGTNTYVGQVATSLTRSDLKQQCDIERSGELGFSMALPSSLRDGRSHTIYAYTGDSPTDNLVPLQFLGNGPPTITCQ